MEVNCHAHSDTRTFASGSVASPGGTRKTELTIIQDNDARFDTRARITCVELDDGQRKWIASETSPEKFPQKHRMGGTTFVVQ